MSNFTYAVEQRMRFIDFLVAQYGTLNRGALVDYFGISTVQASNDIREYMKLAPANISYDLTAKTYVRGPEFFRVWP